MTYNAKEELYQYVDSLREKFSIAVGQPIDSLDLCYQNGSTDIIYHSFEADGFCGAAYAGKKKDTIILNNARSASEQNFDCGHEIIHLTKHRNLQDGIFNCFISGHQDSFLEWEANEGAAQLLVPYQDFIPRFWCYLNAPCPPQNIQGLLADYYRVSQQVINIRIESLSYEIDQYKEGTQLDCLELLSRRQRQKRGIITTSYGVLCDFALDWDSVICAD